MGHQSSVSREGQHDRSGAEGPSGSSGVKNHHHHHHHQRLRQGFVSPSGRPSAGGVAMRRGERRLRSILRHEQQTVRMALATFTHHSAQRQKTARAREEGHEEVHNAPWRQKPLLPSVRSVLTPRREQTWSRSRRSLSRRSAIPSASWTTPKTHPVCKIQGGIVEFDCIAPAPAVAHAAPATVSENMASSPDVACEASALVTEDTASSPAVTFSAPAPLHGRVDTSPDVTYVASAPVGRVCGVRACRHLYSTCSSV